MLTSRCASGGSIRAMGYMLIRHNLLSRWTQVLTSRKPLSPSGGEDLKVALRQPLRLVRRVAGIAPDLRHVFDPPRYQNPIVANQEANDHWPCFRTSLHELLNNAVPFVSHARNPCTRNEKTGIRVKS